MNIILGAIGSIYSLLLLFIVALIGAFIWQCVTRGKPLLLRPRVRLGYRLACWCSKFTPASRRIALANIGEGERLTGNLPRLSDGAIATRHLLVKRGTDDKHIALAGAADTPYGICTDEASAAEEPVNVRLLACASQTVKLVSDGSGALAFGDILVPAASGKVKKIAAGAGNYYVVGMCLATVAATDGEVFEAAPIGAWKTQ